MTDLDTRRRVLAAIGAVTLVSGGVQAAFPGRVLRSLGAQDSPATRQGFATVGMFMVVVGGGGLQAMLGSSPETVDSWARWTGVQKLGAATAVTIGVRRKIFGRAALLVAINDFACGALALRRWAR